MKLAFSKSNLFAVLLIQVLLGSCLDEYNPPELQGNNNLLVVEGLVSDSTTTVRLSRTVDLGSDARFAPEPNAEVQLEDGEGNVQAQLAYQDNGLYQSDIAIDVDGRYRIRILAGENEEYISDLLAFLPTPPIDSVGWELRNNEFQVQVSTHDDISNSRYYRWEYEETWEYFTRHESLLVYEANGDVVPRRRSEQVFRCWRTESSTAILIGNSVNLSENVISKEPIRFIDPSSTGKLALRYSILVRQYSISQEAFEFWNLLKSNTENVGTFFDPQPSQLPTNLVCVNDPSRPVLGYVSASSEQQERMSVGRTEIPYEGLVTVPRPVCELETVSLDPQELEDTFGQGFNLIIFEEYDFFGDLVGYSYAPTFCSDCRVSGGTSIRPDFW